MNAILRKTRKINFFNIFNKSYIIFLLLIIYIPLVFLVLLSFVGAGPRGNIIKDFTGGLNLDNYFNAEKSIFLNNDFLDSFLNSLLVALVVVPISIVLGLMTTIGIWTSKSKNTNKLLLTAVRFNYSIPDIITGISLVLLFSLTWVSFGFNLGYVTVVISHISFLVPYVIMSIYPRIVKINANLLYASLDLGYSKAQTYFKIIIPILKNSIFTAIVLVTTLSFDDFIITSLVNGNFETIGTAIYGSQKGIKAWIVTFGAILVIILMIIIIITSIFNYFKFSKRRTVNKNEKNSKN